ncbi:MAG: hypothetical protein ABL903_18255 [Methylococcales bacterium]
MRFAALLEKLPFLQRVNNVLVCEFDHTGLRAIVVQRKGEHLSITHEASSDAVDFNDAVAEVVAHLREQGWLGKHAIVLSPAVLMALIELRIPPKNKLLPALISKEISWELEPLISKHNSLFEIGRIISNYGYMSEPQIEDVLSHQNDAKGMLNTNAAGAPAYTRFGEIALALGYISQGQLDKCLSRQAWVHAKDEDIKCGWSPQGAVLADQANVEGQFQWLTSAVNQTLLRQWQAAFSAHSVQLSYFYPLSGCATSTLTLDHKLKHNQLLLEVRDTQLTAVHIIGGNINQLHMQANSVTDTLNNCVESYHLLVEHEVEAIWLVDSASKNEVESNALSNNLAHVLQQTINPLARPSYSATLGMLGAARHFMNMRGATSVTGVPVIDPPQPLLQRLDVRAILAGLALLLAIGLAEGVLQIRKSLIASENDKISQDLATVDAAIARVQANVAEVKKLQDTLSAHQLEVERLKSAIGLLSVDLPKRNQTVVSFLNELNKSVSDDVVIDGVTENLNYGFIVDAWSLNESSAQGFVKNFQLAVHPLGFKLKDITVATQTGRLGLLGYSINFNASTAPADLTATNKPAERK